MTTENNLKIYINFYKNNFGLFNGKNGIYIIYPQTTFGLIFKGLI